MMLAAPGQLVAVSALAADRQVSLMADRAAGYPSHDSQAESIYLLRPDLVLTGEYSSRATVAMLRRLGVRVEEIPSANSIDDVRRNITLIGGLLQAKVRADDALAGFDAQLALLPASGVGPVAVNYNPNGYTTGGKTLAGDILRRAGYALLTDRIGLDHGGNLPLEVLVMQDPALIVRGSRYDIPSRSEEILDHPVLERLSASHATVPDRDWICGLPQVAGVAAELAGRR